MIDKSVTEFAALLMQGLSNQRNSGLDEAAHLFAENQLLHKQLEASLKETAELRERLAEVKEMLSQLVPKTQDAQASP